MFSDDTANPPVDCFADRNNLPMLIDFDTKPGYAGLTQEDKREKIVNITAGLDRGFPKSIICSIRDTDRQKLLGLLKTVKLYIDNEPGGSLDDYGDEIEDFLYELKRIHAQSPSNLSNRRAPKRIGTLEEFIDYIESMPPTPDPDMEQKITKLIPYLPKDEITGGRRSRKYRRTSKRRSRKLR